MQHAYIAVGVKGVGGFVEQGAVTIHECTLVAEPDVSYQKLSSLMQAFVKVQLVSVQQMHTTVLACRSCAIVIGCLADRGDCK